VRVCVGRMSWMFFLTVNSVSVLEILGLIIWLHYHACKDKESGHMQWQCWALTKPQLNFACNHADWGGYNEGAAEMRTI